MLQSRAMKTQERRSIIAISLIMSSRMLGLFMILPIFAVAAAHLSGATAGLIGLALGIYGFTQAALQLPFGWLSDRFGRKPIITIGLIIFATGSIVAAMSTSIYGIILGRALQGGGAIGSTLLALLADSTRDEFRSKAMAMIGMTIGVSFSIAFIVGPLVNTYFHLNGIFWLTAIFSVISIILLHTLVPTPPKLLVDPMVEAQASQIGALLKNTALLRLNLGIFSMHAILTASFMALPNVLNSINVTAHQQTLLYLSVLVLAFITMLPFLIFAEKKRRLKQMFLSAVVLITTVEIILFFLHSHFWILVLSLFLFFCAFSLLEATLPSLVSKIAPLQRKGTAMGVYSSSQFFGIFIGGSIGGLVLGYFGAGGIFLFCALIGLIWLSCAYSMPEPPYLSTIIVADCNLTANLAQILKHQAGVAELAYVANAQLLYVKIDKKIISEDELRKRIKQGNLS